MPAKQRKKAKKYNSSDSEPERVVTKQKAKPKKKVQPKARSQPQQRAQVVTGPVNFYIRRYYTRDEKAKENVYEEEMVNSLPEALAMIKKYKKMKDTVYSWIGTNRVPFTHRGA
jgi:hypothetical protein